MKKARKNCNETKQVKFAQQENVSSAKQNVLRSSIRQLKTYIYTNEIVYATL